MVEKNWNIPENSSDLNLCEYKNEHETLDFCDSDLESVINEEIIRKNTDQIKERMNSLQILISNLKEQLKTERQLWKQEVAAVVATQTQFYDHNMCIANYFYSDLDPFECMDEDTICSFSKSEFEFQISKYRNDILKARRLNVVNFYKNLAIDTYRRKLLEVESLCNLELTRVKHSVQSLQPLQIMASEWDHSGAAGDIGLKMDGTHKTIESPEESEKILVECEDINITSKAIEA